jgi:hypothetical protein
MKTLHEAEVLHINRSAPAIIAARFDRIHPFCDDRSLAQRQAAGELLTAAYALVCAITDKPYMSRFTGVLSCDVNDRLRDRHIQICADTLPYLSHGARAD